MTINNVLPALLLLGSCFCSAEQPPAFACNLKAFSHEERKTWQRQIETLRAAVAGYHELADGYEFKLDPKRASIATVAEWIVLERKCCPFFDYQLNYHAEKDSLSLVLNGRDGVKQFIRADFGPWFKAPKP